ncbi:hypothetical protein L6452_06316 [Arctium lappa]|uniref:Uncharacterized protein n=1 Tax=Arctium lappa TaxID=4217 RepID=A0ACB9EIJ7_ARCLA|nr:hypothetical protein L6452_06316 [Arctium lappa]
MKVVPPKKPSSIVDYHPMVIEGETVKAPSGTMSHTDVIGASKLEVFPFLSKDKEVEGLVEGVKKPTSMTMTSKIPTDFMKMESMATLSFFLGGELFPHPSQEAVSRG